MVFNVVPSSLRFGNGSFSAVTKSDFDFHYSFPRGLNPNVIIREKPQMGEGVTRRAYYCSPSFDCVDVTLDSITAKAG